MKEVFEMEIISKSYIQWKQYNMQRTCSNGVNEMYLHEKRVNIWIEKCKLVG